MSRNLLLLLLLALVATCYGQSMARPGTLGAKIGGVAKPAAKDTPVSEPPCVYLADQTALIRPRARLAKEARWSGGCEGLTASDEGA